MQTRYCFIYIGVFTILCLFGDHKSEMVMMIMMMNMMMVMIVMVGNLLVVVSEHRETLPLS